METRKRPRIPTPKLQDILMEKEIKEREKREREEKKIKTAAKTLFHLDSRPTKIPEGSYFSPYGEDIDIIDARMSKIFKRLFGDEMYKEIKRARRGYESTDTPTQCNDTVGPLTEDTDCWICGTNADDTKNVKGLAAICDHVLPVGQAVFFLGLYSTRKKEPTESEFVFSDKIFRLEYDWSHDLCNQEKTDIVLIKKDGIKWAVDEDNIDILLNKIYNSKRVGAKKLMSKIKSKYEGSSWFAESKFRIKSKIQQIVSFINRDTEPNETHLGNLVTLAGWASFVDPENMSPKFLKLLNIEPETKTKRIEGGKRTRRNKER